MKKQLRNVLTAVVLLLMPSLIIAQAPPMGAADNFVLYTSVGAMQNVGTYQYLTLLTGDVGTNSGSNTNFGNVNGVMHEGDGVTAQCNADLIIARDFLVAAIHDSAIVNPVIGNDSTLKAGTYLFPGEAVSLTQTLTLDGEGDPNAVFIFKMAAVSPVYAFSTSANAEVKLINGAQACNVFWYISGAVSIAPGTSMKGTIIAGGAFSMGAEVTLEGRALTINGSVTLNNGDLGLSAYLPVDISTPLPTGPAAPVFVESKNYAVFSSLGDVSDDGTSHVMGSVGSNSSLPTGYNPLFVTGNIEGMNPATAGAKADLLLVYNSLSTLSEDIELLAPAQFGHNLVLTPNTFVMNTAVTFTDTVILDGSGNEDAVFIIKTYGAFASGVHSKVILKNGTQAKNVFWMVNGAVSIGDSSVFKGTIIANNGAIDMLTGASLDGRALTTNGAVSTRGMTAILPIPFVPITPEMQYVCEGDSAGFVVNAIGEGSYTYQWRKGTVNLTNGGNISGVTNDTLIIDPVSDSDTSSSYNVVVFDALEPSDTSISVSLQYYPVPEITVEPANQVVCTVGNSASFSVTAEGMDLTYQWRKGSENYTNTTSISGATSETLIIDPVDNADIRSDYNVVVSNVCGQVVTSSDVSLSISTDLIITSEPTDQAVCEGSPVSFSVAATADGITYQWRKGIVNLSNAGNILGATSATLTIDPVGIADAALDYNVIVSGSCAPNDTSVNASLSVNELFPVSVTIEADANSVCAGTTVLFTATPVNGGTTPAYQWQVNGVNAGTDSDIYSYIPEDGDEVTVVLTSNASCTSGNPASSEAVTMIVNPILPVSVTIEADANSVCAGTTVEYNATPVNGGTTPAYQWKVNGVNAGTDADTYSYIPEDGDEVTVELTSNASCTSGNPVSSEAVTMIVNPTFPVSVTIEADANSVCAGTTVEYNATPVNGGTTPAYQWKVNGVNAGTDSDTYSYIPEDGDEVTVELTSNAGCTSGNPASSEVVTMIVNPILPVSVTIVADANSVCAGTTVLYTATPVNGGTTPAYQWQVNGVNAGTDADTYSYIPEDGDEVTVELTSNASCTSGNPASSEAVTMIVNPILPVSVTIEADANSVCAGTTVLFTATPVNGGTTPAYQWKVNGVNAGTDADTYSYIPEDGDEVTVELTSNASCTSGNPANSEAVTMIVNPTFPVSVTIEADANSVCAGTTVEYNATPVNGGTTPEYQWQVNGVNAGTDADTYSYIPEDGDEVTVELTSNASCTSGSPASSEAVTMIVNPILPVSVTIEADANSVCAGTTVEYNATPVNGGTTPAYQWKVDGVNAGTDADTYSYIPEDGDEVTVVLTSNASCTSGDPASSEAVTMIVNPILPVSVTIEADANSVCAGTTVLFTATPVNGGTTPAYQWKVDGVNAGTDADTYSYIPEDGDEVTVELTSNASCTSGNPASSEAVTMIINAAPVIITEPEDQIAIVGNSASFVVAASGIDITYQWRKGTTILTNEGNISGALSATLTIDPVSLDDAATDYNVVVSGNCLPNATSSNTTLVVTPVGIDPINSSNDNAFTIYPNPFSSLLSISLNDKTVMSIYELRIYNIIGVGVINTLIINDVTNVETSKLPSGLYFYQVLENEKIIQSGKLISNQN